MLSVEMQAIAKDLIDQFGDDFELVKTEIHGYNPITHRNDITETKLPAKGVSESVDSNEIVPGVINLTDQKITMYTESENIDTSWTISGCNIIHISKVGFQNRVIIYDAFVRCK